MARTAAVTFWYNEVQYLEGSEVPDDVVDKVGAHCFGDEVESAPAFQAPIPPDADEVARLAQEQADLDAENAAKAQAEQEAAADEAARQAEAQAQIDAELAAAAGGSTNQ